MFLRDLGCFRFLFWPSLEYCEELDMLYSDWLFRGLLMPFWLDL